MTFVDRQPEQGKEKRRKLTIKSNGGVSALPVNSEIEVDIDYADNPSVEGTPLNSENLNTAYCIASCITGMEVITNKQWDMDSNSIVTNNSSIFDIYSNGVRIKKAGIYEIGMQVYNRSESGQHGGTDWTIFIDNADICFFPAFINAIGAQMQMQQVATARTIVNVNANQIVTLKTLYTSSNGGISTTNHPKTLIVKKIS